ncbi:glucose 1-dehydrogenase [Nocardioides sp. LHD-245]|uniref:SDR family NAD(P)-dependent oxidoreductase n=1 Tax=Nocardioides sp. LHD-245 TaxID=3051387 RepID=UPI0027DF37EB|nr:glucose 1-dehydrogenase [Nocardioides sp. LHD-245]
MSSQRTRSASILDSFRLDHRVALVTGASSGLGVRIATSFAEAGADIVLMARRRDRLEETAAAVARSGRRAVVVEGDITDEADCRAAADAAVAELGRLDVLVNNAGLSRSTTEHPFKAPMDDLRQVVDVNLLGSFAMTRAAAARMTGGGVIVNVASAFGLKASGIPSYMYSASKAALIALTRDLAANLARKDIRVNGIAPGFVDTEMTADETGEMVRAMWEGASLQRRGGGLDEIATAVLFLASDASSFVTGHTLPVDGGWTLA